MNVDELKQLIIPAYSEEALAGVPEGERANYLKYKIFPVELLVKADWNYKEENDYRSTKLRENMKRNGQTETIHVRELDTGYYEVVNGNHRYDEVIALGRKFIVAYDHGKISKSDAMRHAIETNETRFETNQLKLGSILKELNEEYGLDDLVETLPQTEDELANLMAMVDLDQKGKDALGGKVESRSLSDQFMLPPFSILDTRRGWWQDRKRDWIALGISSELGRGDDILFEANQVRDINFYSKKRKAEAQSRKDADKNSNITGAPKTPDYATGTGTENIAPGTSIFDPVLAELMYKWFCVTGGAVLDTFAGGSVRGVVASKLGYYYTGLELREEQVAANIEQGKQICSEDLQPKWITGDSLLTLDKIENESQDFIFSCPPYYDLEVYSDDPSDLSNKTWEEFVDLYTQIIVKSVEKLRPNRFACFVVGDIRDKSGFYRGFVDVTRQAFESGGALFYNDIILVNVAGSLPIRVRRAFSSNRKVGKMHQNVLVFYKGDVKGIKEEFPEVIIPEELTGANGEQIPDGVEEL